MRISTTVEAAGGTTTGLPIPDDVALSFGRGRKFPVRVTIGEHTYRSSLVFYRGQFVISLSAANREAAGVAAGDDVEIDVEVDDAPRTVVVPDDLAAALADADARAAFDALSYSKQRAIVEPIEAAKASETRQRRVDKVVASLR
ncbi:YdeI/OmpD-associated family protein [Cellulosimicrobium arenosum]|uniref:DUF1905 domain-containing protein n=1 Tax=Cellulosimicrobium arenosum TaxID=2708133 RepID=A0A927J0F7_9MICO|nr:YdeI/OmpD-associated family protein [Cellulosimicrobium arenosum]MBD8079588.1 DUF1905 domain-containing protein [Cellulosimicrobium arenosum]